MMAGKNLKTFEEAVNTFFGGKFDSAVLQTDYTTNRSW